MDPQVGGHVGIEVAEAVERAQGQVKEEATQDRGDAGPVEAPHAQRHHLVRRYRASQKTLPFPKNQNIPDLLSDDKESNFF